MSCGKYQSEVWRELALGAAEPAREAELPAHLAECEACRVEFEAARSLVAAIDRGLADAMAAEPSPEFAARVRQRIAERDAARPWYLGWAPAAVSVLAVSILFFVWESQRTARVVEPPAIVLRQAAPPVEVKRETPQPAPTAAAAHAQRVVRHVRAAERAAPEVIVPPGELAAVLRMYDAAWGGKVDAASMVAQRPPLDEVMKPIVIAEMKFEPLDSTKAETKRRE